MPFFKSVWDLNVKEEIVIEKREDENWVYSKEIYDAEANIASKLILLDSAQNIKRIAGFDSELEKIEKEILNNNKDNLEWLEIIRNGTKYTVRVEERIINKEIDDNKNYDIVSSKNAVIRVIEAESGEKVRDINTYVKKGETIISAYITTPSEEKILSTARGKVIGEVWYIIDINYPYYHHEVKYTGNKKNVINCVHIFPIETIAVFFNSSFPLLIIRFSFLS